MSLSARLLGKEYGLTAQEMNRVLVKRGILQGTPGNYSVTEFGKNFASVKDFHRGCGGYDFYNRHWSTTSYDESIRNVLNVTDEVRKAAIKEAADHRAMQRVQKAFEIAKGEAEQLANEQKIINDQLMRSKNLKVAGIVAAVGVSLIVTGIVAYKVTPKIKAHIAKRKEEKAKGVEDKDENIPCDNADDKTIS